MPKPLRLKVEFEFTPLPDHPEQGAENYIAQMMRRLQRRAEFLFTDVDAWRWQLVEVDSPDEKIAAARRAIYANPNVQGTVAEALERSETQ